MLRPGCLRLTGGAQELYRLRQAGLSRVPVFHVHPKVRERGPKAAAKEIE